MLEHGGRLRAAAARSDITLADWIDLSTGINPHGWPVPPLPPEVWQRLPEANDGLEEAAAAYYGNPDSLLVAGSQAAIQWLPALLPRAVARLALGDHDWQAAERLRLHAASERLAALLAPLGEVTHCPLFATLKSEHAASLHEHLARRAILTRRFPELPLLRVGLPADEAGWKKLGCTLSEWSPT